MHADEKEWEKMEYEKPREDTTNFNAHRDEKYQKKWYKWFFWSGDSSYYSEVWTELETLKGILRSDSPVDKINDQIETVKNKCEIYKKMRPLHSRKTQLGKDRYALVYQVNQLMEALSTQINGGENQEDKDLISDEQHDSDVSSEDIIPEDHEDLPHSDVSSEDIIPEDHEDLPHKDVNPLLADAIRSDNLIDLFPADNEELGYQNFQKKREELMRKGSKKSTYEDKVDVIYEIWGLCLLYMYRYPKGAHYQEMSAENDKLSNMFVDGVSLQACKTYDMPDDSQIKTHLTKVWHFGGKTILKIAIENDEHGNKKSEKVVPIHEKTPAEIYNEEQAAKKDQNSKKKHADDSKNTEILPQNMPVNPISEERQEQPEIEPEIEQIEEAVEEIDTSESDDEDDILNEEELEQEDIVMTDDEHKGEFNPNYKRKYTIKDYITEDFKISDITPSDKDIKQGGDTGDCALLANLASLAKVNPKAIKDCFVSETENTVTVRLFEDDTKFIYDEFGELVDYIPIVKKVHITMQKTSWPQLSKGAAWVRMLEKAFSLYFIYQKGQGDHRAPEKVCLGGVEADCYMFPLTGQSAESPGLDRDKKYDWLGNESGGKAFSSKSYSKERLALYKRIKKELESGRPVVGGRSACCAETPGLAAKHGYGIIGADEDTPAGWPSGYKYITIRNPHKDQIRTYEFANGKFDKAIYQIPPNDAEKGVSKLELNDFCNCFSYITLRKKKQKGDNE